MLDQTAPGFANIHQMVLHTPTNATMIAASANAGIKIVLLSCFLFAFSVLELLTLVRSMKDCSNLCIAEHFHSLNAFHQCAQEHVCKNDCQVPGICLIEHAKAQKIQEYKVVSLNHK